MKDYDERRAAFVKRQQDEADEERDSSVKVGEVRGDVTGNIKVTDNVKVRIDNVETLRFKPPVDLKKGDSVKVTIEKVQKKTGSIREYRHE
ncbi:MAG: hypothetical protein ABIH46_07295 [Chloroflexota bacterium]